MFICLFTLKLYTDDIQVEKIISIISVFILYGGIRLLGVLKMCIVRINSYKKNSFVINVILNELKKEIMIIIQIILFIKNLSTVIVISK